MFRMFNSKITDDKTEHIYSTYRVNTYGFFTKKYTHAKSIK